MNSAPTADIRGYYPVTRKGNSDDTVTLQQVRALLLTKCKEIQASLPETGWADAVWEMHRLGQLAEVYALGAALGYLHADIRFTIWGNRL